MPKDRITERIKSYTPHETLLSALCLGVAEFHRLAAHLNGGTILIPTVKAWTVTFDDAGMVYDIPEDCHRELIAAIRKALRR